MRSSALGFDRVLYLVVRQDLSSAIPIRRDAPGLTGADWKARRLEKATRLLKENIDKNERKLHALEELLPSTSRRFSGSRVGNLSSTLLKPGKYPPGDIYKTEDLPKLVGKKLTAPTYLVGDFLYVGKVDGKDSFASFTSPPLRIHHLSQ